MELHVDFETRSTVDLKKTGVHVYAEDPATDIWCMAFAFTGQEPALWIPGQPVPMEVADHVDRGGVLVAHNAAFEISIWRSILAPRYGFPETRIEQWRCTMAQAYAMALPGALADAAQALGLEQEKDAAGHRLMLSMAKPRKIEKDGTIIWWEDEARKRRLYDYCLQDVRTEMALDKRLLRLRPEEQRLWWLDQKINDRGVYVDEKACIAAKDIVEKARKGYNLEIRNASNFEITSTTATAQIINYLQKRGVDVPGLAKDQVVEMLTRDLPDDCRAVLDLRQKGARMSVSKIDALLNGRSKDGRARGLLQYHAASTGRWGGRRFQPQNLKRPGVDQATIDFLISLLKRDFTAQDLLGKKAWTAEQSSLARFEAFGVFADDPIEALGDCIRGMVCAPPGKVMGAADFANIEGRVLAWLAGEDWKVDAFRAYDAGTGPDLYKLAFSRSFGKPIDAVSKDDRQVGKVQELALGYQGGPGAFQAMARGYGVDIGARYDEIVEVAEEDTVWEAAEAWAAYGKKSGMGRENWIAAEIIKRAWRKAHPATVALWANIEEAALSAVRRPGTVVTLGKLKFRVSGSFLFMQLPSERVLCYPYPKVATKTTPWGAEKELVEFFGQDTFTRKWGLTSTYGGKLTENAVQAIARDLLAEALLRLDDAGIETVLHVHDEDVFYGDESVGLCEHVCSIMSQVPPWAAGLPVVAEGWVGERYRK